MTRVAHTIGGVQSGCVPRRIIMPPYGCWAMRAARALKNGFVIVSATLSGVVSGRVAFYVETSQSELYRKCPDGVTILFNVIGRVVVSHCFGIQTVQRYEDAPDDPNLMSRFVKQLPVAVAVLDSSLRSMWPSVRSGAVSSFAGRRCRHGRSWMTLCQAFLSDRGNFSTGSMPVG